MPTKIETSVQPKSVVEPEKKETAIEPEDKAVENSSSVKPEQQERVQEPVEQVLTKPIEQSKPVTSDDYMDFESALAAGAF